MSKAKNSQLTIAALCRRAGISRQAYYQGRKRAGERRQVAGQVLEWVRAERAKHPRMGGRKLYRKLLPRMRQAGIKMGRDKLFGLLRVNNLLVSPPRSSGPRTTNGAATKWTNQLAEADITGPNQAWVADITYLRTFDGFCYLALISDYYSRKILGWDVADSLELQGALRALQQALRQQPESTGPMHHSDRAGQYRSRRYVQTLTGNDCTISMTEENHCAENAQAERLNGILKDEYLMDQVFPSTEQAQRAARQAIKLYNTDRPHLSLDYDTPDQVHRAA
jgi:transposase InsO family protein